MLRLRIDKFQKAPVIYIWAFIIGLFVLTMGVLSSRFFSNITQEDEIIHLTNQAQLISSIIYPEQIEPVALNPKDTANPDFVKLKVALERFCNQLNSIRYIYILQKKEDKLSFIIDTESDENRKKTIRKTAQPGEDYADAPKEFFKAFEQNSTVVTQPYSDKWGRFISVVIPINNNLGQPIAVVGVDVEISYWENSLRVKKMFPIAISLIFIALIVSVAIVLRYKIDIQKDKLILASRFEKYYSKNHHATFFFDVDYRVLYYNEKAIEFSAVFLTQPLKIGKKFIETIKDEQHKKNLLDNTQLLFTQNHLEVDIRYLGRYFKLVYQYIQPTESDTPFISLSILDTTNFEECEIKGKLLECINEITEDESQAFSFTTNQEFIIDYVSPQIVKCIGYHPDNIKRLPVSSIFSEDSYLNLTELLENNSSQAVLNVLFKTLNKQQLLFKTKVTRVEHGVEKVFYVFTCYLVEIQEDKLPSQTVSDLYLTHDVIDSLPGFAYRCKFDNQWTMTYLSKGFEKVCGYSISDVLMNQRLSYNDIIIPKYRQNLVALWDDSLANHLLFSAEYEILSANGELKWVWEQGYGVYNADDTIVELQGFVFDITTCKNKELDLMSELNVLKGYIDDAQQGFIQIDNQSNLIRINNSMLHSLGSSIEVLRTLKLSDLIHPSSDNEYTVFINTLLNQAFAEAELILISTDKMKIPVFVNAKKRNDNEFIINIINLTTIPQSTYTHHTLNWVSVLNKINQPVCVINHKEKVVCFSNDLFKQLNQELVLKALCDNPNIGDCSVDLLIDLIEKGEMLNGKTVTFVDENNYPQKIIAFVNSIHEGLEISHTVMSFHDVSSYSQENEILILKNNQLKNKLMSKSKFYLNAGNDIRSTFNAIIGNTEILINSNIDTPLKSFTYSIKDASIKTIDAINSIIDLAKMESGNVDFVYEPFYIEDVVSSLVASYAPVCEEKGIQFIVNLDDHLMNEIISDEILIKKAFSGILANVINHTQNGTVTLNFELLTQSNSIWLKVLIVNTGTAVPIEIVHSYEDSLIDNPHFYKNESSTDLNFSICVNLVELLNGTISLSNRIGIGSELEIRVPIVFTDKQPKNKAYCQSNSLNILIANPYSDELKSMEQMLNRFNAISNIAFTGIEAAQIITNISKEGTILDFAFIDYDLNGMSFEEVINVLKENGCNRYYVLCKHREYESINERFSGAYNLLVKPVLPSVLKKIIQTKPVKSSRNSLNIEFVKLPSSFTILVVEDNAINLLMLKEILSMSGAKVFEATDGQEAYVSFLTNQPDLIFMDIHMPSMNGFESTKMIRNYCKENPSQKSPTIIALTANTINNLKINYKLYELDGFISKPYQITDIQHCLTKFKDTNEHP